MTAIATTRATASDDLVSSAQPHHITSIDMSLAAVSIVPAARRARPSETRTGRDTAKEIETVIVIVIVMIIIGREEGMETEIREIETETEILGRGIGRRTGREIVIVIVIAAMIGTEIEAVTGGGIAMIGTVIMVMIGIGIGRDVEGMFQSIDTCQGSETGGESLARWRRQCD